MKILLVDLDGTIRETLSGDLFSRHPYDQTIIPGANEALLHYLNLGYICIGISNQGGVESGYKTLTEAIEEQLYCLKLFPQIRSIYFCPDFKGKQCYWVHRKKTDHFYAYSQKELASWNQVVGTYPRSFLIGCVADDFSFRKPGSGMLQRAIEDYTGYSLSQFLDMVNNGVSEAIYVGDRPEDSLAAENANINFLHAESWRHEFVELANCQIIDSKSG